MTEQEFVDRWVAAVMQKNQKKMLRLAEKAIHQFGKPTADELARNCYEGIAEVDPELGEWLASWFEFMRYR